MLEQSRRAYARSDLESYKLPCNNVIYVVYMYAGKVDEDKSKTKDQGC